MRLHASRAIVIHDVLIIGGGPAGTTVAWLLARAGWSVVLLEKASFPRRKVCGEFISAATLPLLQVFGLDEMFLDMAGPPVREVGLYAGPNRLAAPMPADHGHYSSWGRALGREHLDAALLEGARHAGVDVLQPCAATGLARDREILICTAKRSDPDTKIELQARAAIAAHGSWEKGKLPTQIERHNPRSSDLLAFKARFVHADLPVSLMPLLAFPGGYGGMVHADRGRTSLSCCIRRDVLQQCRRGSNTHHRAGDAVLAHVMSNCEGVQRALRRATTQDEWLSAGPIQPGIRTLYKDGIFAVGNAGGEAHPVIAEGIGMAMQGAWLLAELLIVRRRQVLSGNMDEIGCAYARAWRRQFAQRLHISRLFAHLAMRPAATNILLPLFQYIPGVLTLCSRFSGKTTKVVAVHP